MWLKFDLTTGEIAELCRKAGEGDWEEHLRTYYDNLRMQIFARLDWLTKEFLQHPSSYDADRGWCREIDGNVGRDLYPRWPVNPTRTQIVQTQVISLTNLQRAWTNIDILVPHAWSSTQEPAVLLAATRTATYIANRAWSMKQEEDLGRKQKTALYFTPTAMEPH